MSNREAFALARSALRAGDRAVLVSVASVKGSAPREVGACMLVTESAVGGSIGGGKLEWHAISRARELSDNASWELESVTLSADIGQCCGGKVELLFESLDSCDREWLESIATSGRTGHLSSYCSPTDRRKAWQRDPCHTGLVIDDSVTALHHPVEPGAADLLLFGAGHVGRALADLLRSLPFRLHHVDNREDYASPDVELVDNPEAILRSVAPGTLVLIMTHDHALDYRITERALCTEAVHWVGLIGSQSKRNQLIRRLRRSLGDAATESALPRLACPIGRRSHSRAPAELATLIAAELIHAREACADTARLQRHAERA